MAPLEVAGGPRPGALAAGRSAGLRPLRPADEGPLPGRQGRPLRLPRGVSDYAEPLCQTTAAGCSTSWSRASSWPRSTPAPWRRAWRRSPTSSKNAGGWPSCGGRGWNGGSYEAERAARQFHAVGPENRLVGRELERRWEQALKNDQPLRREYGEFLSGLRPPVARGACGTAGVGERPARVVEGRDHDTADRQRVARLLLDRVVVEVLGPGSGRGPAGMGRRP